MRDLMVGTLLLSSGVWFSLGFAYADIGMLQVSAVFVLLTTLFVVGEFTLMLISRRKSYDVETFVCIRYGVEFFLEDVNQVLRPSTRKEVARLFKQNRITKFK